MENTTLITILFYLLTFVLILLINVAVTLSVAFLTLLERKVMGFMQRRVGPSKVGLMGILQPLADGLKLILKETIRPSSANRFLFIFAPIFTFLISLSSWLAVPIDFYSAVSNINIGVMYLLAISSVNVYGIILGGWSSNSRYAFLGSLRASAQMISYELSIGFVFLTIFVLVGSLKISAIICAQSALGTWFIFSNWPLALAFFVCGLAETSRAPFDLPEAESELVSGYNVEYSAAAFAAFFLAEYCHIFTFSAIMTIVFLGGHLPIYPFSTPSPFWFVLKLMCIVFVFIWVRASLPRYRYDQLMRAGWKTILPAVLIWFFIVLLVIYIFGLTPPIGGYSHSHISNY